MAGLDLAYRQNPPLVSVSEARRGHEVAVGAQQPFTWSSSILQSANTDTCQVGFTQGSTSAGIEFNYRSGSSEVLFMSASSQTAYGLSLTASISKANPVTAATALAAKVAAGYSLIVRGDDGREFDAGSVVMATIDSASGNTTIENLQDKLITTGVNLQIDYRSPVNVGSSWAPPTRNLVTTAGVSASFYNPSSGKLDFRFGASSFDVGDKKITVAIQKEFRAEPLLSPVENDCKDVLKAVVW